MLVPPRLGTCHADVVLEVMIAVLIFFYPGSLIICIMFQLDAPAILALQEPYLPQR